MKAVILKNPAPVGKALLELADMPVPEPQKKQLLIRVSTCGICHTDLHTVEGEVVAPAYPLIPGHQIVGVVEATGEGVSRFKKGDRVGVGWLNSTCGQCEYCRKGLENLCSEARFTGLHAGGGYAEYAVASENFAFSLPENFTDEKAAPLLCAGIIGYRTLRLSGVRPGEVLGLFGFGASAHLALQVAVHWNCRVYVFTRSQHHRELAENLGAVWAGGHDDEPPEKLNAAAVFAPAGWVVHKALEKLKPGGRVAINAIYMSDMPPTPYNLIYRERSITTVANYTRRDAEEFLKIAGEIPVQVHVETFPLEKAREALFKLKNSEIQGAAALKIR